MSDEAKGQSTNNGAERVLHVLARLELPEGMHDRIVLRLEQHDGARKSQWLNGFAASLWPVPLAVAALVAVILCGSPWHRHFKRSAQPSLAASSPIAAHGSFGPEFQSVAHPLTGESRQAHSATRRTRLRREPGQSSAMVSYPAPPAPLTKEEKLLLQVSSLRAPGAIEATRALVHAEPVKPPGNRLPTLSMTVPGERLPTMASEVPGVPLPDFHQVMNTGDQP